MKNTHTSLKEIVSQEIIETGKQCYLSLEAQVINYTTFANKVLPLNRLLL